MAMKDMFDQAHLEPDQSSHMTSSNKINHEPVSLYTYSGLISSTDCNIHTNNHMFKSTTTDNWVNLMESQYDKNDQEYVEHSNFTTKEGKNDLIKDRTPESEFGTIFV